MSSGALGYDDQFAHIGRNDVDSMSIVRGQEIGLQYNAGRSGGNHRAGRHKQEAIGELAGQR